MCLPRGGGDSGRGNAQPGALRERTWQLLLQVVCDGLARLGLGERGEAHDGEGGEEEERGVRVTKGVDQRDADADGDEVRQRIDRHVRRELAERLLLRATRGRRLLSRWLLCRGTHERVLDRCVYEWRETEQRDVHVAAICTLAPTWP